MFKLDIARAFDSVSWEYLLELLQWLGFNAKWRERIDLLLSTSTSSFILNRSPGAAIIHRRELTQGAPLSSLFFIILIDPLHQLLEDATEMELFAPLPGQGIKLRVCLYTDDVIFSLTLIGRRSMP